MRILYLTDRLSLRGGADLHLRDQVVEIAERHQVMVAYGSRQQGARLPKNVVEMRLRSLSSAVDDGAQLERLEHLFEAADVVHLQNVMNPKVIAAASATGRAVATVQDHRVFCPGPGKSLPNGERCVTPMGPEVCGGCATDADYSRRMIALTDARRLALGGARLVVLSRYMKNELAAVGLDHAEIIPPWVSPSEHQAAAGDGVMIAGRLVAQKGLRDAWAAYELSAVAQPFRVAGAGSLAEGLGGQHLGWLSRPELRRHLRDARVLLFPAGWQEPFGIVAVEALAEGTPVIVSDSGGTDEWSDQGCVSVPRGDVAAMAAALVELCQDDGRARVLGEQGRRMVEARFARIELIVRLEALYQDVARQKN